LSQEKDWDEQRQLVRSVLITTFHAKCSAHDCADTISQLFCMDISHQTILRILQNASTVAKKYLENQSLSLIKSAACDEIFQKSQPILGLVDLKTAYLQLDRSSDRSGASWEAFLTNLKDQGLSIGSATIDGGLGMTKGLKEVFPDTVVVRDLFHVLRKLSKASHKMEGILRSDQQI
jgi:hypothetical protein